MHIGSKFACRLVIAEKIAENLAEKLVEEFASIISPYRINLNHSYIKKPIMKGFESYCIFNKLATERKVKIIIFFYTHGEVL